MPITTATFSISEITKDNRVNLQVFEEWLKKFQLIYNLSPNLSPKQIKMLEKKFNQIIK